MKAHVKRRRIVRQLGRRIDRLEKRQDRTVREVLNAVVHVLEEYAVPGEPIHGKKR